MAGRYDDLVTRLTDATTDGWANILGRGATFTWEVWNPSDAAGDSMSHGWGSNVLVQIQRSLLGVRPTGPGYATFEVSPPAGGLAGASGSLPTPRGGISVAWSAPTAPDPAILTRGDGAPEQRRRRVRAGGGGRTITEGGRPISRAPGVRLVGVTGGVAHLELGAGTYHVVSSPVP